MRRILGWILIVLSLQTLAFGSFNLLTRRPTKDDTESTYLQARLDVFIPGGIMLVVGFVLLAKRSQDSLVEAIPAERSITVSITPAAGDHFSKLKLERNYPPESGLRIVPGTRANAAEVKFDVMSEDDFMGDSGGVSVFVQEAQAVNFSGRTIDLVDGELRVI